MQFALAHQTASAETEAELRSLVVGLQGDNEMNKDLVLSLQSELERSQQKVKELEEQLRWQQLENQNQIVIKEAKILELKKLLNPNEFTEGTLKEVKYNSFINKYHSPKERG